METNIHIQDRSFPIEDLFKKVESLARVDFIVNNNIPGISENTDSWELLECWLSNNISDENGNFQEKALSKINNNISPIEYLAKHYHGSTKDGLFYRFKASDTIEVKEKTQFSSFRKIKIKNKTKQKRCKEDNDNYENLFISNQKQFSSLVFENSNIRELIIVPIVSKVLDRKYLGSYLILTFFSHYCDHTEFIMQSILCHYKRKTLSLLFDTIGREFRKSSIKTAKTAIMSRNMSHNLGSHVMSYLKAKLRSVDKLVSAGVLENIFNECACLFDPKNNKECGIKPYLEELRAQNKNAKDNTKLDKEMPFLVGLGHFIGYLQERQDYIATISTDYIPYFNTVNFKDDIYDALNRDDRFTRHDTRSGYMPENILLDNIARSEDIIRKNICISFGKFDGLNDYKRIEENGKYKLLDKNNNPIPEDTTKGATVGDGFVSMEHLRKSNVDLPGGVTGRQAIFSIVENIIRNAAKHRSSELKSSGKKLTIRFDLYNLSDKEVSIVDLNRPIEKNNSFTPTVILNKNSGNYNKLLTSYKLFTITDNDDRDKDTADKIVAKLQEAINEDYIDDSGKMKDTYKGIKEMRISAAWLRRIKDENALKQEVTDGEALPLIQIRAVKKENEDKYNLQYVFFLKSPKSLAFVYPDTEDGNKIEKLNKTYNSEHQWYFYTLSEFKKDIEVDFDLIVARDSDVYDELNNITNCYLLKILDDENTNVNSIEKPEELDRLTIESGLFESFTKEFVGKELPKIYIVDKKIDSYKDNCKTDKIILHDKETKAADYKNNVIFKTHYDNLSDFNDLEDVFKGKPEEPFFVEGISGHNSTDRLIRNEMLDELWYYKQVISSHTKVAIFDERLFPKKYNLSPADIKNLLNSSTNGIDKATLKRIESSVENLHFTLDENKRKLNKLFKEFKESLGIEDIRINEAINDVKENVFYENSYCSADEKKDNLLTKIKEKITPFYSGLERYESTVFSRKNVFIFTLIEVTEANESYFAILGKLGTSVDSKIAKIGSVRKDKEGEIEVNMPAELKNYFHNFLIHQGLLDKLYGYMGYKMETNDTSKGKRKLTTELCKNLLFEYREESEKPLKEDSHKGFIIHSGRSKPSKTDMPQKQPFLQYASLEHAVDDCKLTLVELLNSSRHE